METRDSIISTSNLIPKSGTFVLLSLAVWSHGTSELLPGQQMLCCTYSLMITPKSVSGGFKHVSMEDNIKN
ncbi:hypothetical protein N7489_000386, partial [Penicillium chrysogenum]